MRTSNSILKTCSVVLFFMSVFLFSCSKDENTPNPPPPSEPGTLTSFYFADSINTIPVNSQAEINGNNVVVFLPPGTNVTNLKANFAVTDGKLNLNGAVQQSGVSATDFTNPVNYIVKGNDSSVKNYTVTLITNIDAIDQQVTAFMAKYKVPALSFAITQDERLVYSKAYGLADKESNTPATTASLFRLASVSKQITAVTIMKLIDQGKLNINDKVFGPGSVFGNTYGTLPYGPGVTDITVGQLLHHTSGGWADDSNNYDDPAFQNPTFTGAQNISWVLDNIPLDTVPGTHYDYSNFGFYLLGRVVEKVTGMNYVDAAKQLVLTPSGITTMQHGKQGKAGKFPNEVTYYPQDGDQDPYTLIMDRMDSFGGWIASAEDLTKFLVHIDNLSPLSNILSNATTQLMITPSTANPNYACGWIIPGNGNWWHNGSLPGTTTEQVRSVSDGHFNFVILTNTRTFTGDIGGDMDKMFWNALPNIPSWPSYDLFQ